MTGRLLVTRTFPGVADEVAVARRVVRGAAAAHLGVRAEAEHSALDDLELLTSEIVSNALRHTRSGRGGQVRLALLASDHSFRVEVIDQGGISRRPEVRGDPAGDAERGRGLVLVEALAKEWGAEPAGRGGKTWFEVAF
jgi:anti-sigma regulatory factor (Ser/Thr protein kinase)